MALRDNLDRLSDSVDGLAGEVKSSLGHMTSELRGLDQSIYELAERVQWVCNNLQSDQWRPTSVRVDASVPGFEKLVEGMKDGNRRTVMPRQLEHAMDPVRLACRICECPPPLSLEQALFAGWTELMHDETDEWNFLGLCPDCRVQGKAEAATCIGGPVECHCCKAKGPPSIDDALKAQWVSVSYGKPDGYVGLCPACHEKEKADYLAEIERGTRDEVYCCVTPKLQWNGDPVAPGIECESCGYVVAECGSLANYREELDEEVKEEVSTEPPDPQGSLF